MRDRPILFSAPMVRAILDGQKTQTRRVMKSQPVRIGPSWVWRVYGWLADKRNPIDVYGGGSPKPCPYGQPGDSIWVREAWQAFVEHDKLPPRDIPVGADIQYPATYDGWASKVRRSFHMCRWMSRIDLEVTAVRVERLQEISEVDARAEGVEPCGFCQEITFDTDGKASVKERSGTAVGAYMQLWEEINGPVSWGLNPWVWVIEFRRVKP